MSYEEGYSENNGVKIFYRDYGPKSATPVLLVHGLGAQLVHWPEHLIDFLIENNYRPITLIIEILGYQQDLKRNHQLF